MIEIHDEQSVIAIKPEDFKEFAKKSARLLPESENKSLTIAFVDDDKIKELNSKYRNKPKTTDVLSFPYESDDFEENTDYLGDIVISTNQAKKQAFENDLELNIEIKQLILHGILHLCGYDHETDNGEMNELELKLRDKLNI